MIARTCSPILAALLLAGCGSSGPERSPQASPTTAPRATSSTSTPAFDASQDAVAAYLTGRWSVTLQPEAASEGVTPPKVSARFSVDESDVSGRLAGSDIQTGNLVVAPDGRELPRLAMTTDGMTVAGPTGDDIEVEGPIDWKAELYEGKLIGTAVGPDGKTSDWEAVRQ